MEFRGGGGGGGGIYCIVRRSGSMSRQSNMYNNNNNNNNNLRRTVIGDKNCFPLESLKGVFTVIDFLLIKINILFFS